MKIQNYLEEEIFYFAWVTKKDERINKELIWPCFRVVETLTLPMVTSFSLPSFTISNSVHTMSFCWSGMLSWLLDAELDPYTSDNTLEICTTPIFFKGGLTLLGLFGQSKKQI